MVPLEFRLTGEQIGLVEPAWDPRYGAEVSFFGVVRGLENGQEIAGIEYSAYPEMVAECAAATGKAAARDFAPHRARIIHREGFVPVAQPSVLMQVGSAHSDAAMAICSWYLSELKRTFPIWKKIVPQPER